MKVLLHACCAPCSTVSTKRLEDFALAIFWYNPNIEPKEEHDKRLDNLKIFAEKVGLELINPNYNYSTENQKWNDFVAGLEKEPEGGKRCDKCFEFRLQESAGQARNRNFNSFSTTLTVSPHKNSTKVNAAGRLASQLTKVEFLEKDFKKGDGYLRSIELSKEFNLYRQNHCGCLYSRKQKA